MIFGEFFEVYKDFIVCFFLKDLLIYFKKGEGILRLDKIFFIVWFLLLIFFVVLKKDFVFKIVNCILKGYNFFFDFVFIGIKYYEFKKLLYVLILFIWLDIDKNF